MVLEIFKIAARLRDWHVFMWQSLEILNVFYTGVSGVFQLEVLKLKTQHVHTKLPCQKPMLRQIEWVVQNGPITKNRVLPVYLIILKILFQFKNLL